MTHVAKLFTNGRSQAVRLPVAFRFDVTEVYVRQDPHTGDVILSKRPGDWGGFIKALQAAEVPADFLGDVERRQAAGSRDPLSGIVS